MAMNLSELTLNAPPLLDLDVSTERDAISGVAGLLDMSGEISDFPKFLNTVFERQKINPSLL